VKTEDLIATLARGEAKAGPARPRLMLMLCVLAGLAIAALLIIVGLGVRPDIRNAVLPVMAKAGFAAMGAGAVLPLAARLMRPGRPLGWRVAAVFVFVAASILATIIALMHEPAAKRMGAWMGDGFPWCLVVIPLVATPAAALLVWLARGFAPTRITLTGAAIGGLSGGLGAMAYAMYCPVDSVAFVTTWYGVAIAFCAAMGALVASRFLRW
jgi:hypothetical protein